MSEVTLALNGREWRASAPEGATLENCNNSGDEEQTEADAPQASQPAAA